MICENDVVQFNENHKWCGSLGIVDEVKPIINDLGKNINRYMVGVPIPQQGTAYVFCKDTDICYIGKAILIPKDNGTENEDTLSDYSEGDCNEQRI